MTERHINQAIAALLKEHHAGPQRDMAEGLMRQAAAWVRKMETPDANK